MEAEIRGLKRELHLASEGGRNKKIPERGGLEERDRELIRLRGLLEAAEAEILVLKSSDSGLPEEIDELKSEAKRLEASLEVEQRRRERAEVMGVQLTGEISSLQEQMDESDLEARSF